MGLLKRILLFSSLLMVLACSSAPTIIEREIKVPIVIPSVRDSLIELRDTIMVKDTLWFGEVTDSLNKVIGQITVDFKKKIASLNIKSRVDTVIYRDTLRIENTNLLPAINGVFTWWEKLIMYGGMGLIFSLLMYLRVKRGKI